MTFGRLTREAKLLLRSCGPTVTARRSTRPDSRRESPDIHGSVGGAPASAVQPYFDPNIYANYHQGRQPSFWEWSTGIDLVYEPRRILRARPDLSASSGKAPNGSHGSTRATGWSDAFLAASRGRTALSSERVTSCSGA